MFWTSGHAEQEHVGRENKDVCCCSRPSWWNGNIRGKATRLHLNSLIHKKQNQVITPKIKNQEGKFSTWHATNLHVTQVHV